MLFVPPDMSKPIRLQGSFVSDKEIFNLVNYLKDQGVGPEYKEEVLQMVTKPSSKISTWGGEVDEYFDEAIEIAVSAQKASASLLQRKLSIGYARAARIIDELEEKGLIGPPDGSKPRAVLIDSIPDQEKPVLENADEDTPPPNLEEYNPEEQRALNKIDSIG